MAATDHVYDALIIGAGYGGLGTAAQLRRAGLDDFVIWERAGDIGGVWRDNTYPGAACDTQSVIYCFTFFPHLDVTRLFSPQEELLAYLRALAEEFDIMPHVRLNTEAVRAEWIEAEALWEVTSAAGEIVRARLFVPAWGQLGTPLIPDFPGMDRFEGVSFHSARWDHSVELAGKRVASIGAAASAVQYVPFVAEQAAQLTVFQRSANYILPRNQKVFTDEERKRFRDDPSSFEALRREIHEMREAGFQRVRHATAEQGTAIAEARAHLESQVADPVLREKLTPDYEFGCKRILRSDDYYPALTRENVSLETERIAEFTEAGIRTADGVEHRFDVVVFGTGFRSQAFQGDLEIVGTGGRRLDERWGDSPEAYLGLAVDGFPNMLLVYGPNTNLNHNSIVTMIEVQSEFIVDAVRQVREHPGTVYDITPERVAAYNDHVQQELAESAYSSDCSSWYKNAAGKVINNWYGTVEEYRRLVRGATPADFGVEREPVGVAQ